MPYSLEMEWLNERISNVDGIYIITINIIISITFVLSIKILINLSAKIQALEKPDKTDHRDTQIQTKEFNGELISALHYKNREDQPKVFKQPSLIYAVT